MTAPFTPTYPLAPIKTVMGISAPHEAQGLPLNLAGGRGTRITDLHLLLAVHAARQAMGPTARIVRSSDLPVVAGDEPARMALIFASTRANPAALHRAAGSFNTAVAARMAIGADGERGVYLGT